MSDWMNSHPQPIRNHVTHFKGVEAISKIDLKMLVVQKAVLSHACDLPCDRLRLRLFTKCCS